MAEIICSLKKRGSSGGTDLTASAFVKISGSPVSIANAKKGNYIYAYITQSYSSSITITNGVELSRVPINSGTGSTWTFVVCIQVTGDGVTITKANSGANFSVNYSLVSFE